MSINGINGYLIPDFPNYMVTIDGRVFNIETGREMFLSPTRYGELTVGLVRNGKQYRRSVKGLVARAFVDGETEVFDTPILLDGDRNNLHADNIRWRPRWFAWRYIRQFTEEYPRWFFAGPILDIKNNIRYENVFEAAIINGNLCEHIYWSLQNEFLVFPGLEIYVYTD